MALVAGIPLAEVLAVDRAREDAGRCGLARSAWPSKQKSMGHLTGCQGVSEGSDNVILADHFVKTERTPFSVEHVYSGSVVVR